MAPASKSSKTAPPEAPALISDGAGLKHETKGAIVRVGMKNFVTYKDVQVRPGPFLNVVIGPNGTGKSTLVCAICIGLAGKTSWLGRSTNAADFIKHGEDKAELEVELFNDDGDNFLIQSEISNLGSVTWRLNGVRKNKKDIETLVEQLNIQVGNLCQFLPQDKVADFAKMSPEELLENTQKAVDPNLHKRHDELKTIRSEMKRFETSTDNERVDLDAEIQKNKALEGDVENFQRRQRFQDEIKVLEQKRPWLEYEAKRLEFSREKDKLKEKETVVQRLRKEAAPLARSEQEATKAATLVDKKMTELTAQLNETNRAANDVVKKNERERNKLDEIKGNLELAMKEEEKRRSKTALIQNAIAGLKAKLDEVGAQQDDSAELARRLAQIDGELREIRHQTVNLDNSVVAVDRELAGLNRQLEQLQNQQKQLLDVQNRRLERLRQWHRPTYDAVMWLRSNRGRFRGVIHEPMMLVIDVANLDDAKYIENSVSNNDKKAFVCEDPDDMEEFLRVMRGELNLSVNAVQAPQDPPQAFQPQHPIQHYAPMGFRSFLREMFSAPAPVVAYLCKMYRIHSTPVGGEQAKRNMDQVFQRHPEITLFYSDNSRVQAKRSRYSGENLISQSQIQRGDLFTATVDRERVTGVEQQITLIKQEIETRKTSRRQTMEERRAADVNNQNLLSQKRNLTTEMNQKRTLQEQIDQKTRQLRSHEAEAVDVADLKRKAKEDTRSALKKRLLLIVDHAKKAEEQRTVCQVRAACILKAAQAKERLDAAKKAHAEATETLRREEREWEQAKTAVNELKTEANRLRAEALHACGMRGSDAQLPKALQLLFDGLPDQVEEIDAQIFDLRAKADCIAAVDPAKIDEFERRRRKIAELQERLNSRRDQFETQKAKMKTLEESWRPELDQLITKIDKNFSAFMAHLGCAGEVDLYVPEVNPDDFAAYGIRIKVKFRSSETLRELTAHHQSGGERAVSTVLYMMSLQELTKCPFRCVDEINQGMDPVNERKIFKLVVDTACNRSEARSQYFLLTPKLLANMIDECDASRMTVLTIYNGLGMVNHKDWNLKKFIKRRRTLVE